MKEETVQVVVGGNEGKPLGSHVLSYKAELGAREVQLCREAHTKGRWQVRNRAQACVPSQAASVLCLSFGWRRHVYCP